MSERPLPFHGPADAPAGPRLLLISYHFPPSTATGALRWQKLAAHAAARGWGLDVVTADPARLQKAETSRLEELPAGTRVFAVQPQPSLTDRLLRAIDRLRPARQKGSTKNAAKSAGAADGEAPRAALPESEVPAFRPTPAHIMAAVRVWRYLGKDLSWGDAAYRVAAAVADPGVHRAVIACGPPHVANMAAEKLSRRTGIALVIDMRDPWGRASMVPAYCASPLFFHILRRREARAVERAALVVVNTDAHRTALQAVHARHADRIKCVLNGCDIEQVPPLRRDARFAITYAGNIYLDRDPRPLFRAAARVIRERELSPAQFAIELIGDVHAFAGRSIAELAREAGVADHVHLHDRLPRREVLQFLTGSPMLLSLPQSAHLSVPSKVFEYMQFEAWILALASSGSATELVLRGTGVDLCEPDDEDAITAAIAHRYDAYTAGQRPARLIERNPHLTRQHQAGRFFDELARALPQGAPVPATAVPEEPAMVQAMATGQHA